MTFSRVKAAGWSINEKLSSAQMTQLDIDHAASIDKTGDSVSGPITFLSGSTLQLNSGANGTINNTLVIGSTGKVTTSGTGSIELANNDYPKLAVGHTGRSRTITTSFNTVNITSAGNVGFNLGAAPFYVSVTTASSGSPAALYFPIPKWCLHNGATLSSIDVYFIVLNTKVAVAATMPSLAIKAIPALSVGSTAPAIVDLSTSALQYYPAPGSLGIWTDNNVKKMTYTCNQNNVIAAGSEYYIQLTDESGANTAVGNMYYQLGFNYTLITDMRFA